MMIFEKLQSRYKNPKTKFDIKEYIDSGADGEAYLTNNNNVIKFSILFDLSYDFQMFKKSSEILKNLNDIKNNPIDCYVKVINNDYLFDNQIKTKIGNQFYCLYYYTMEKLNHLSDDEVSAIRTLAPQVDKNNPTIDLTKAKSAINEVSNYLDFNANKLLKFYSSYINCRYHHNDFHSRNIMKDSDGNFKLVDLDRITKKEKQNATKE